MSKPIWANVTHTVSYTSTLYDQPLYSCTYLCSNNTSRCYAGPETGAYPTSIVSYQVTVSDVVSWPPNPTPSPNCTIATSDCKSMWSKYQSDFNRWQTTHTDFGFQTKDPVQRPACQESVCSSTTCTFQHADVKGEYPQRKNRAWPFTCRLDQLPRTHRLGRNIVYQVTSCRAKLTVSL